MIHNLQNGPVVLTVAAVDVAVSEKFGSEQYKLTDTNNDLLFIGKPAADKQLARLKLDAESIIGKTIRVERVEKNGTKFTNIYLAAPGETAPQTATNAPTSASARSGNGPVAPMDLSAIAALYSQCVDKAIATLGVQCEAAGIAYDASAIQAAAATMFIRATK